jgi:hypothetical protein
MKDIGVLPPISLCGLTSLLSIHQSSTFLRASPNVDRTQRYVAIVLADGRRPHGGSESVSANRSESPGLQSFNPALNGL